MNRIRVLLAEDHETVRHGLRLLLEAEGDIEVVGEAADGRLAVQRSVSLRPQVVILDLSMPELSGLEAARAIKRTAPDVAIVALTRHDHEAFVREIMTVGASGYVLKQSASNELLRAVRSAAKGEQYLDTVLLKQASSVPDSAPRRKPRITEREKTVLRLMALGHSNKEIAAALELSVKTVEVHKANAMRKLHLRGRVDVMRFAMLEGWLSEPGGL
jgi:DNA-binding NarL/FixJ family response regulator